MSDISIKNGHIVDKTDKYTLYKIVTSDTNKYYMCLPTFDHESYQMIIDFPEEYYKSLLETEMITEIKKICDTLYRQSNNSIYILSNITTYDLREALSENDDHAYMTLLNNLQKCTYNAYEALNNNIVISNVIGIITQTKDDEKFMHYLEVSMPGFFTNIDLSDLLHKATINDDTGWTTKGGPVNGSESIEHTNHLSKPKVKKLIPTSKHGFLNITFIFIIICLSLILGIGLAILLIS